MLRPELLIYVHTPIHTLLKWKQPGGLLSKFKPGGLAGREPVSLYQDSRPSAPWPAAPPVSPEPGSGADVRATRGQHLSAAQSGQQMSASPPCHPRGPGVLDGPGPHPRPRPSAGRPILRPLSLLGRKPTFSFFPLPLHFLPSHLPSSLALLFLFSHFSPLRQPHPHLKKSPASKVFPCYGLESNVLEVLGGRVIKIKKI